MKKKKDYLVWDAILDVLKAHWVSTIFGYPWWTILPFYDVLINHRKDIQHVLVRNEQAAAFAAQWWARSTKKLWVCCSTSGPWATNLVTWIADAYLDSVPILCITGQVPLAMIWKDMFQEVDMTWITLNITKHNYLIENAEEVVYKVTEAIAIATSWRPWPVHIDVPKDIMASKHPEKFEIPVIDLIKTDPLIKNYDFIDIKIIDSVIKMLASAKKPVLLIGQWIKYSNAEEQVNKFVEILWIPVVSTLLWKWIFSFDDPNYLWMIWMHWFYHANMAIHEADLILNIWSRFDDRIVWRYDSFWKNAKIIHVDIDNSELNKVVSSDIPINSDALLFIKEMIAHPKFKELSISPWHSKIDKWRKNHPYVRSTKDFTMRTALNLIMEEVLKDHSNYILAPDVGQHQMWTSLSCNVPSSINWLASWWSWTMWFSLPSCIWAAKANPDKTIISISWDWWIQMNLQELQTIKECKLNIKVIILNNNFLWMVRQWQELFYERNYSQVLITSPDFQKLAEAFWIDGYLVKSKADFSKIWKKIFSSKMPQLIEFKVVKEDNVFPMVPWWNSLGEMRLEK